MKAKLRPRCYFDIDIGHSPAGRIIFELYDDICPKTSDNFRLLCTGEGGNCKTSDKKLHYLGSSFHRVVKGFMIQGGDFLNGDGTGGESIFGGRFEDENFNVEHNKPYLLSMANCGPNTNGSQFFITTKETPHLNGKHVVFGHVVSGDDLIQSIENLPVNESKRPIVDATISNCGELVPVIKKKSKKTKDKEESVESSSSKGKKKKKSKKKKKNKKKIKAAKREESEDENIQCSVRPDEIPEVPKPFFLYRGNLKKDEIEETNKNEEASTDQNYISGNERKMDKSGRTTKGRGKLRYQPSPKDRSETPPHWRKQRNYNIDIDVTNDKSENNHKRKRNSSNESFNDWTSKPKRDRMDLRKSNGDKYKENKMSSNHENNSKTSLTHEKSNDQQNIETTENNKDQSKRTGNVTSNKLVDYQDDFTDNVETDKTNEKLPINKRDLKLNTKDRKSHSPNKESPTNDEKMNTKHRYSKYDKRDRLYDYNKKRAVSPRRKYSSHSSDRRNKRVSKSHTKSSKRHSPKRPTKSPPAHLVERWKNRRQQIRGRQNEPATHSRYSRSLSNDKIGSRKISKESKGHRHSSGTLDSSPSSTRSSASDRPSRIDSDLSDHEKNINTQSWINASAPQATVSKKESEKETKETNKNVSSSEKIELPPPVTTKEPVLVIKPQEKPLFKNQWKDVDSEEGMESKNISILAKLKEQEMKRQNLIKNISIFAKDNKELKKIASPVSQSISKCRSPSGTRSPDSDGSSSSSSSRSASYRKSRSRSSRGRSYQRKNKYYRRSRSSRSRRMRHRSTSRSRSYTPRRRRYTSRSFSHSSSGTRRSERYYSSRRNRRRSTSISRY